MAKHQSEELPVEEQMVLKCMQSKSNFMARNEFNWLGQGLVLGFLNDNEYLGCLKGCNFFTM